MATKSLTAEELTASGVSVAARTRMAKALAVGTLVGGSLAVLTTYLAFTGKKSEAAVLGITTGLVGAVPGSLQIYALYRSDILMAATDAHEQAMLVQSAAVDKPTYISGVFGAARR